MSRIIEPRISEVPEALASRHQWVVWKSVPKKDRPGEFTKIPYSPKGYKASSTKRADWGTFDEACDTYLLEGGFDGIGFVFTPDDDFIGVDVDGCFDEDGNLNDDGREVVSLLDSYSERSVSGNGLHVICRGRLPGSGHCDNKTGHEIYQEGRFFTITADIIDGKGVVNERPEQVRELYENWFGAKSVESFIAADFDWDNDAKIISLDELNIDDYTRNLIRNGEGIEDFANHDGQPDRSLAMFFVSRQMVYAGANKETILTILTDDNFYLGMPATERRGNRQSAMEWVWKYTVAKLFRQVEEEKNLFDTMVDDTEQDEFTIEQTSTENETTSSKDKVEYVKNNFNRNALLFLSHETPLVRQEQQFYKYNQKYWQKLDDEQFESDVHIAMSRGAKDMSMGQINNTIKAVKRFATRKTFTISKTKICFKNGVIDFDGWDMGLADLAILPHSPKHWVLNHLDFDYDDTATCPVWDKFLVDVFEGDKDCIRLLQQWFGYNIIYDYRFQKMLIAAGESRSGKGTIMHILQLLVGKDNYVGTSLRAFTTDFGLEGMMHAKSVVVPDAVQVEKSKINSVREALLNITSGDVVSVNRKFKSIAVGHIPARITLVANQVPRFADEYDALFNRYMVLPFRVSFAGREDVRLVNKLEAEVQGIFNWAVKGLMDLGVTGRFIEPKRSLEEAKELRELANPIKTFIEKFIIIDPESKVSVGEVYDLYERFCAEIDMKAIYNKQFGKRMTSILPNVKSVPVRENGTVAKFYSGVRLNMEALSEHIRVEF